MFPLLLLIAGVPAAGQIVGPPLPRITPQPGCKQTPAGADEIVVCGEGGEDSPLRIPREFRNRETFEDRHASRSSRVWDENSLDRFSSQTSGPFGYLQYSRQLGCQGLAARQEAQGRRPDCGAKARPDEATDWQRGRR
jgi:hypothetical protein